ncbi:hypothetical protein DCCM_4369 [Desulfocucumis palustris]|uniref:GGDEF domain-containing protein n=1 Tax=Desulfocucumis palustris TaxID=1898651 RepID=A0A2L2XLR7_9FIRM|nr:sensor domain-containing diguanylate cyclase [Desulfocucumis palustris]GBF35246.1 hypothetical protein DCCM_4369 [Desulfocucumis palustris]
MLPLKYFTLQEISLLEAELFIAKLRKWAVCLGVAVGALYARFDSLSAAQGVVAAAAVFYCFKIEGYYRSAGVKGLKHLSTLLDFALLWGVLAASWPGCNCHAAMLNGKGEFSVVASSPDKLPGKLELGSVITGKLVEEMAPVVEQGRTTGLVLMESNKLREFNNGELALIMLASGQMGISLENAGLYERMERLARFDELTNIYNRRAFNEVVEAELVRAKQKIAGFSLVMVDIDFFKRINDRWGHQFGDRVLAQVAEAIKQSLRAEDSVARFGGEEFVILLPGADCRTALQVAERVRRGVEGVNWQDGLGVTVSAGVASYPEDGEKLAELLKNADLALYKAKSGGRNQVRHVCGIGAEGQMVC